MKTRFDEVLLTPPADNSGTPKVELSVVIVHYKTPHLTLECLRSIFAFAPACPFEVIVLDNGSNDRIESQITEQFPQVRFIETGANTGFSRANNLGIHNAHGEFIVLLNSDTCLKEQVFDPMLQYFKENPQVGVLGPRHVDAEGKFQLSCGKFPTLISEIFRKIWHYRLSINDYRVRDFLDEKHSNMSSVDWVSGSCLLMRRKVLDGRGLLDERFFMYFEDIDLCKRIQMQGGRIHFFPYASIVHYGGGSVRQNLLAAMVEYRHSQIYFTKKYYGHLGSVLIRLLILVKYGMNLLKWGLCYLADKFLGREEIKSYTMALAAKKIVAVTLGPISSKPIEPVLTIPAEKLS